MNLPNRILVVDEDSAARTHMAGLLSDAGHAWLAAASCRDARDRIAEDAGIAVVVADVLAAQCDGAHLGQCIRECLPGRPWLQVLFVTGRPDLELAVSALRLGAVDYLAKPVAPRELVPAVNRALAASGAVARTLAARSGSTGAATRPAKVAQVVAPVSPEAAAVTALDYLAGLRELRRSSGLLSGIDEASWTIVLEIYRAEMAGRRLSVSKLCALDEASQTTAWRRLKSMERDGILVREADAADARRSLVRLTQVATLAVDDFMRRADGLLARNA